MSKEQRDDLGCGRAAPTGTAGVLPELPAWRAFVVQFNRESGVESGICAGRVEHLSSGRRARFASRDDLLDVLTRLLAELGDPQN